MVSRPVLLSSTCPNSSYYLKDKLYTMLGYSKFVTNSFLGKILVLQKTYEPKIMPFKLLSTFFP